MRFSRSLRFRVATAFAAIGGVISLLMAVGLYVGVRDAGRRLIDETLGAEMQDYLSRRARNPHSLPPATATLLGYLAPAAAGEPAPPAAVAALPPACTKSAWAGCSIAWRSPSVPASAISCSTTKPCCATSRPA